MNERSRHEQLRDDDIDARVNAGRERVVTAYLRTCAGGGGHHAAHNSTSFGGVYLCPKHLWSLMHGFNPQPYGTPGGTDQTVKFIDGSIPGPMHGERRETEWVVLEREGDVLTLRRLGLPDSAPITTHVNTVYPADPGGVYRHASRCGLAPSERVA